MAADKSVLTKWERNLACVSIAALGVSSIAAFYSLSYMNGLASVRVSELVSANQAVAERAAQLSYSIAQTHAELRIAKTKVDELEMGNVGALEIMHDEDLPLDAIKGRNLIYLERNELALQQVGESLGMAFEDLARAQDGIWMLWQEPALKRGAELRPSAGPEQLSEQAQQNVQAELTHVVQTAAQAFENANGDADAKALRADLQSIVQSAQAVAEGLGIQLETVALDTGSGARVRTPEPAAGPDTQQQGETRTQEQQSPAPEEQPAAQ